jgi:hypothetical protein
MTQPVPAPASCWSVRQPPMTKINRSKKSQIKTFSRGISYEKVLKKQRRTI